MHVSAPPFKIAFQLCLLLSLLQAPLPPALAAPAVATAGPARWEAEIQALEATDKTNPPPARPVVFVGSSSIRLWKTLARDFAPVPVLNRGFGGSELIDSVYFAERLILASQPRMIVIYAGGNDINGGKSPNQVHGDFCALTAKIHAHLPKVPIAYISIAPNPARWAQVDQVRCANQLIAETCAKDPRLRFIDVFEKMLGPDGLPKPGLFVEDRLHMNEQGYALWKDIVRPHLEAGARQER